MFVRDIFDKLGSLVRLRIFRMKYCSRSASVASAFFV